MLETFGKWAEVCNLKNLGHKNLGPGWSVGGSRLLHQMVFCCGLMGECAS